MSGEKLLRAVRKYLKKEGRVGFELRQLNELFRAGGEIKEILEDIGKHRSLGIALKVLMLVHRLILEGSQPPDSLLLILSSLHYQPKDQFQQLLSGRLLDCYRLYLQRRILIWTWVPELPSRSEDSIRFYQLFNLITLGVSFADVIYTLGRYYMQRFGCSVDFNILLGADLQGLYHNMVECVDRPAKKEVLEEIQGLHEKLYVVYYNCYFHKYLKNYLPKWVITDIGARRGARDGRDGRDERESEKRSASSAKTKANTPAREKEEMGDSCLFLFEKEEERQEGLRLLMSMERVVNQSLC